MSVPKELLYTEEHEWVNDKNDNTIIGITDFAQSQLGDIIFLESVSYTHLTLPTKRIV